MQRYIYTGLTTLFILLLLSCSAAPPVEPTTGFEPYSAPLKPANLTATNGREDTIVLTWDETEGATSYQVWAVDASSYGSESSATTRTESYATLIERGFKLLDVVSDTTYTLKGESTNSSYVFSIVAMKSVRSTSSSSVLYSEPSSFVEGSTVGEIILSAVANSEKVALFWDISNLYSVLDNSAEKTPLYSYTLTLYSKLSSSTEWNEGETVGDEEKKRNSAVIRSSTLDIDTEYDFRLKLDVMDDEGSVINSVESDIYTITTDSSLVPDRVEDIVAASGLRRNEVTLTWTVPALPERDDITPAFRIDRTEDGTVWTTLEAEAVKNDETTYSITDTTLEDNTLYTYRIVNGYTLEGKGSIFQSDADAGTVKNVYSLWLPEDIQFRFTEGIDVYHGTISVTYTYNPPAAAGKASFSIGGEKWTEKDLASHIDILADEATQRGLSIDSTEPLTYFSFYFVFSFNGDEILKVTNPEDVTLGVTEAADDLFEGLTATTDWVGKIRLSWTEKTDGTYEIYEGADPIDVSAIEDGDKRYIDITSSDSSTHNYRVKLTSASGSFQVGEASGKTLSLPSDLTASDSTSTEGIFITWTPDSGSGVIYTLQYSEDGENWADLAETAPGEATLTAKKDGTDGNEYLFRLEAYNSNQPDNPRTYSMTETGSVFGAALLKAEVVNNGLDPDQITITWNAVEGAKFYRIKRGDTELPDKAYSTTYTDKATTIQNLISSETPLSDEYTYTVVPYLDDKTPAVVTDKTTEATVTGKLFAPPKNVRASKGTAVGSITITWDSVENAAAYRIDKYIINLKNGVTGSGSLNSSVTVTGTSYTEEDSTLAGSKYVKYVLSSLKEDGTSSLQQTGSETISNSLGFDESADIGYSLHTVEMLRVASAENDGVYAPYTVVTWSLVPGATSYRLTSSAGSTVINVSDLSYSTSAVTTNGKNENESGYLAFNPETEQYTYNDNSGLLTKTPITNYTIIAVNGTAESGSRDNNSTVYRQPTEEDWVNITLNILRPAFIAANKNFEGDWWINNPWAWESPSNSYTYGSTGMTFNLYTNSISANYPNEKNYLSISEYTDSANNIKLVTTTNIQVDCTNGGDAGNLGTDPLSLIGYNGNGTISITPLDAKLKPATIKFSNINVNTADGSGTYTVTLGGSSKTINDDASFTRVLGD